ncbi:MAG: methyl-accepting chemotaxis protein [Clostridia bacterium]|nr:methyl-accepting chemotaxis protein [Clostridia bacterium]
MKMKLGTKIMAGYVIVLILLAAIAFFAIDGMGSMENSYNKIVDINMPTVISVGQLEVYELEIRSQVRGYMLYGDEKYVQQFNETNQKFKGEIEKLKALVQTDKSKEYITILEDAHNNYVREATTVINYLKAGQRDKGMAHTAVALPYAKVFDEKAEEFIGFANTTVNGWVDQAKAESVNTQNISIITAVLAVIIGLGAGIYLTRAISRPVIGLTGAANLLAEGNLTAQVPDIKNGDELEQLGQSFTTMVQNLRSLIQNIYASSQQVASTSQELSATSEEVSASTQQVAKAMEELSRGNMEQSEGVTRSSQLVNQLTDAISQIANGAQEQARNVSQTSQMIEQMAQGVDDVAASTQRVAEGAKMASDTAEEGGHAVEKTIEGMKRIKVTVFESANRIKELGEQSQQIGEIIQVIDDIAEQTNLLALNAAIEAARAGEHGKGFAVVADEVRKLAERSGKATKEIATLINNIQKGTLVAVEAMEIGTKEVEQGAQLADDAGIALRKILTTITEANDQIQSISAAIEQVSASSAEVVKAVDNVAAITEENTAATEEMSANSIQVQTAISNIAAIVEESSAAAEQVSASTEEMNATTEEIAASAQTLSGMAEELQTMVSKFKI